MEYTKDYASLLLKQYEDLTKYNSKLRQENDELRDRLNIMALALSDLNRKVEDTENEKLSLVTALKILHEEQANDLKDHSRPDGWQKNSKVNKARSNATSKEVINIDLGTNEQVNGTGVVIRNRYEPLNSEVLENNKSMGAPGGTIIALKP